jgi:hypothetical protein
MKFSQNSNISSIKIKTESGTGFNNIKIENGSLYEETEAKLIKNKFLIKNRNNYLKNKIN